MPPPFSIWILLGLLAAFGASCVVFWIHTQRWTHKRQWVALRDWAGANRFRLHRGHRAFVSEPISQLTLPPPRALVLLERRGTALLQIDTPAAEGGATQRWNVLIRDMAAEWPATGLRPAMHERSLVDLFKLASFPALLSSERYTIHGVDPAAARVAARSMLIALLPHDLGLILHGRRLILDFSTRPFDGIELSRVVSLADQLLAHVPGLRKDN